MYILRSMYFFFNKNNAIQLAGRSGNHFMTLSSYLAMGYCCRSRLVSFCFCFCFCFSPFFIVCVTRRLRNHPTRMARGVGVAGISRGHQAVFPSLQTGTTCNYRLSYLPNGFPSVIACTCVGFSIVHVTDSCFSIISRLY